jgi:hypothetical protein
MREKGPSAGESRGKGEKVQNPIFSGKTTYDFEET